VSEDVGLKFEKNYPVPIRIWNFFGKTGLQRKIKTDDLLKKAKRNTRLEDFGNEFFMEPLEVLVKSINEEAELHAFGRYVTKARLVNLLSNRLRAEDYLKRNPQINDIELLPIWWISGLQRTGTTFLHRLLATVPGTATIKSWEALNPVPLEKDFQNKKRIAMARTSEKGFRYIAPDFFAIHPVEHLSPEEEILLLDISFMSTVPEATLRVPTYAKWLEKQDQTPAYDYMQKLIRIIQFQKGVKKRWVLKSPHHLEYLDTLTNVFPGTNFIFTHRDPLQTIASFCSMIYFSRRIFSSNVDEMEIGHHWLRKIKLMLEKSMKFRAMNKDVECADISYQNLIKDPFGQVKIILDRYSNTVTETDRKAIQRSVKQNKRDKFGLHNYELQDFGLAGNALEDEFLEYKTKYSQYL
jgi:hypothetical protein